MLSSSVAEDATNRIAFNHAPVSEVLSFYERISGLKLVVDSHVKTSGYWMTAESSPAENKTLMKLIEKTLETQAGIVITKLDDNKRASVTHNDALIKDSLEGFSGVPKRSISRPADSLVNQISGTWTEYGIGWTTTYKYGITNIYDFVANGTFTNITRTPSGAESKTGTWKIKDGNMTMMYPGGVTVTQADILGYGIVFHIIHLDDHQLLMENAGHTNILIR